MIKKEKEKKLSAVILNAQKQLGISQYKLADLLGVDRKIVYSWRKQRTTMPLWVAVALIRLGMSRELIVNSLLEDYSENRITEISDGYAAHDKRRWKKKDSS